MCLSAEDIRFAVSVIALDRYTCFFLKITRVQGECYVVGFSCYHGCWLCDAIIITRILCDRVLSSWVRIALPFVVNRIAFLYL